MVGYYSRYILTSVVISGFVTFLLYSASSDGWDAELFFLRWFGYFAISYFIRTLLNNSWREKQNLINFTLTLAESIDARDSYTAFHSRNVAYYSYKIGQSVNLTHKECIHLYIGGLLHDIGKIGISESILHKPTCLSNGEYEQIKKHPQLG